MKPLVALLMALLFVAGTFIYILMDMNKGLAAKISYLEQKEEIYREELQEIENAKIAQCEVKNGYDYKNDYGK